MHCSANLSTSAFPIQNFTPKVSSVLDYDNTVLNWAKRSGFLDRGVKPDLRMSGRVNVLIDLKWIAESLKLLINFPDFMLADHTSHLYAKRFSPKNGSKNA